MHRLSALAGTALAACPGTALAQEAPSQAPAGSAATPSDRAQAGIITYPPEFFAASSPNTAFDMIQRIPGFGLDTGNSEARGLAGAQGNVLIDGGRPSSKTDKLSDILQRIPATAVERIELIRGGAPGIDMQGRSVIANVLLRKAASTQMVLETNIYLYRDGYAGPLLKAQYSRREGDKLTEAAFSATTDRTSGTAKGQRTRFDAAGLPFQEADLDLWDRYRNGSLRGSIHRPAGGGKLRVNALIDYTSFSNMQDITIRSGPGFNDHNQDVNHAWSGELGVNWTKALGPRTELNLTALQRGSRERYDSSSRSGSGSTSEFDNDALGGESVLRGTLKYQQSSRWSFEGGGEAAYNFLDNASSYSQNAAAVALPNAEVLVSELRGEVFAQATFRPSASLTFESGLRVEQSTIRQSGDTDRSKSFVYPKPRFQATWVPGTGHQIRLRAERSVGQLNFGDFSASTEINLGTVAGGNADLEPQKLTTYEAVYERRFWGKGAVELTLQHVDIEDVIDVIPLVGGFDAVGNIGSGWYNYAQARVTLPFDKLGMANALLSARFSYQQSQVTDPLTGAHRSLSREIPFGCGISFNHDLSGGRFSYGFEHGCNIDRFTAYRVREVRAVDNSPFVSIYGQWKPNPKMTVRVDLGNVSNMRIASSREVHTGPRDTSPVQFSETRMSRMGQYLFLQLRHVL
ncbi:TonB-dependent receptor plug domain-containing protein [Sphingomonas soli]|uniref:TonB-dependent receptor plug domain-containing protein n=1 Tax=Sphingomonas soli TaxID=266127 RepID=UPI000AF20AC2|nr:TonB-dependent receptor [Sphingomonas soli]